MRGEIAAYLTEMSSSGVPRHLFIVRVAAMMTEAAHQRATRNASAWGGSRTRDREKETPA
jgi:hypothetical protein